MGRSARLVPRDIFRLRALFLIALLPLCAAGIAAADPIPMPPALTKFMTKPEEQRVVGANALRDWKITVPSCSDPQLQRANVLIHVLPTFDASGAPVSGAWQVITHWGGCGQSKMFNLLYGFAPDGRMIRTPLLPGSTAADLRLQADALLYAGLGMQKLTPGCKDIRVIDTDFEAFGEATAGVQPSRNARPWTERWSVRACGVEGVVKMHFIPNATGTTISTSLDETARTPKK